MRKQYTFRISQDEIDRLQVLASRLGLTASATLRHALAHYIFEESSSETDSSPVHPAKVRAAAHVLKGLASE